MYQDYELESGLKRLKYSFSLYAVSAVIAWIPLIGGIGGLLALVALILLIMGWRALGRSNLKGAGRYHSTSNILIVTLVLALVVTILGIIFAASLFAANFATVPPPTNPANLAAIPGVQSFLMNLFVPVGVGIAIALIGQWKSALSLRELSKEISEPRIRTSGNLLLLTFGLVAIDIIIVGSLLPGLVSSLTTSSSGTMQINGLSLMFAGNLLAVGLISIVQIAILLIACILGYLGLNDASFKFSALRLSSPNRNYPATPPPPQIDSSAGNQSIRYCTSCGNKIQSSDIFCATCGAKA